MQSEDDVFLKTFTQMNDLLKTIQLTLDSLKKTAEIIQLSIDGLGTGLTDLNNNIIDLKHNLESFTTKFEKLPLSEVSQEKEVQKKPIKSKSPKAKPEIATSKEKAVEKKESPDVRPSTSTAQHPIFIDLVKKVNESTSYKEIGTILVDSLDQIESNFSFSRVFYEIRRVGNGLIRKGEKDMPPNDKMELIENLLDWESRLVE